jgi:AMP deaminase
MISIIQTNVPDIRLAFRHQTLVEELDMVRGKTASHDTTQEIRHTMLPTVDAVAARAMAKHG